MAYVYYYIFLSSVIASLLSHHIHSYIERH